jgi:predicted protein tyrosine phosphatase
MNQYRILFVCSRNQWRSPTAENLWRQHPQVQARSAGTASSARHTVNADDIAWASHIMVMEDKHAERLKASFGMALRHKPLYVLDITDEYCYMDTVLIAALEESVAALLSFD